MNDESSSSVSPPAHPEPAPQETPPDVDITPTATDIAERRKRNRENFNKRRGELLDDLLQNLDLLVYAELSAVYYMDCSFFRFCLRAFVQLVFLTPKPSIFPEPPSGHRPFIGGIFGSNLLCILLHIFLSAPSAGEATRGYLHGGLAMDFIGFRGPTSKVHLVLLDLLLLAIQVVHLSAYVLRQRLKEGTASPVTITTSVGGQYNAQPVSAGQSLDHEERGVRHSEERAASDNIEMHNLNPESSAAVQTNSAIERESLLASTALPQRTDAHVFDAFNSGQIVIADLDLIKTVKEQFWAYQKALPETNRVAASAEANRALRERFARRMLTWQSNRNQERSTAV